MCNLNIIIKNKLDEYTNKSIPAFLMAVTKNSYENNNDGDGMFLSNSNKIYKGKRKVNLYRYEKDISESNFVVTHQRIATSGMTSKYIQPFTNKEFILAHNGVINELAEDNHSDTYIFFKKFIKEMKITTKVNRCSKITDSIRKVVKSIRFGSYSIAIYDKVDETLYYFKNFGTSICLYTNPNLFYITTRWDNKELLNIFNLKFDEYILKEHIIYKINIKKKIKIRKVGKIEREDYRNVWEESIITKRDGLERVFSGPFETQKKFENYEKGFNSVITGVGLCCECKRPATKIFEVTREPVCDKCLEEWRKFEEINNYYINGGY